MSDMRYNRDDDFDEGPIYDDPRGRHLSPLARTLVIAALCVAGVAFAGLVWFAYNEGVRSGIEEAAPALRADPTPVKRRPADAGGMQIPHQDKLVYNRIAPGQVEQPVERLLPPPEAPVARPAAPTVPAKPEPQEAVSTAPVPVPEPKQQAEVERKADEVAADKPSPFVREPNGAETADAGDRKQTLVPPPPPPLSSERAQAAVAPIRQSPPAPATAGPSWRIQLASLSSESGARQEWDRVRKANTDLLGSLALNLQQAKLSKGTFYRIQAGPLADRAAAAQLCGKLKSRKQDCLVVAP